MDSDVARRLRRLARRLGRRLAPGARESEYEGMLSPSLLTRIVAAPSYPAVYLKFSQPEAVGVRFIRPVAPEFARQLRAAGVRVLRGREDFAASARKIVIDAGDDAEAMAQLEKAFAS
ncbi:hypothetical protein FACS1894186_8030 [Alphaproteobacteria bacterium]|nr:hypothetical protein FACS1894186_8030 [Alphaproteobacteria bacterium]